MAIGGSNRQRNLEYLRKMKKEAREALLQRLGKVDLDEVDLVKEDRIDLSNREQMKRVAQQMFDHPSSQGGSKGKNDADAGVHGGSSGQKPVMVANDGSTMRDVSSGIIPNHRPNIKPNLVPGNGVGPNMGQDSDVYGSGNWKPNSFADAMNDVVNAYGRKHPNHKLSFDQARKLTEKALKSVDPGSRPADPFEKGDPNVSHEGFPDPEKLQWSRGDTWSVRQPSKDRPASRTWDGKQPDIKARGKGSSGSSKGGGASIKPGVPSYDSSQENWGRKFLDIFKSK